MPSGLRSKKKVFGKCPCNYFIIATRLPIFLSTRGGAVNSAKPKIPGTRNSIRPMSMRRVPPPVLAADLRRRIRGEVRFDPGSRALYATDGSNYRQVPIGVVIPKVADDVVETLAVARR